MPLFSVLFLGLVLYDLDDKSETESQIPLTFQFLLRSDLNTWVMVEISIDWNVVSVPVRSRV